MNENATEIYMACQENRDINMIPKRCANDAVQISAGMGARPFSNH